ncbi:hypothetical protein Pla110_41880 [Polystyrenella longa]|uniref:Uncharacterized protein n=1 Tax=Polystyrenella longa TaxID=2528007 RepID=A0A518CT75_9PLAN|nr:hypothetical protein [Polystyrenella longa]QDU82432.1 hypothetical protein Pla110_41880 [Polystyrenella longa]
MNFLMQPWHLLGFTLSSWVNREQQLAIEYLKTENGILRNKLGKKRVSSPVSTTGCNSCAECSDER